MAARIVTIIGPCALWTQCFTSFSAPAAQTAGGETTKHQIANRCKNPVPTMNARYCVMRQKVSESNKKGNTIMVRTPTLWE